MARLSGRRTCEKCQAVFHVTQRLAKVEGRCDRCDEKLFQREDDRPESIRVRREAYDRSTAPLIEFYQKVGLLLRVAATGAPGEILKITLTYLTGGAVGGLTHSKLILRCRFQKKSSVGASRPDGASVQGPNFPIRC